MIKQRGQLIYSPSDLIRFMESPFASWMERFYLEYPEQIKPDEESPEQKLIFETGNKHELEFLNKLRSEKRDICEIHRGDKAELATKEAILSGREVIYQPCLALGEWRGYADFLIRSPDEKGNGTYEVWDTKLARKTKPYYLMQLCCYAEMLEPIIGVRPFKVGVILGDGSPPQFNTADFFHYYLQLKTAFLRQMAEFNPNNSPLPDPMAEHGRWSSHAEGKLLKMDHLSQIAGITASQIKKLEKNGINTFTQLANSSNLKIPKLSAEITSKLVEQASLQLQTRQLRAQQKTEQLIPPLFKILRPPIDQPRRGLAILPPKDEGDIYFDMEGFPLIEGGLEYLWGAVFIKNNAPDFIDWWAHDAKQEKIAFEKFIDWAYARWKRNPAMHIYHYAPYEISAVRRLMGKHRTRETQVDDFLRHGVFVDLYKIVCQGLRVGEPNYSIKSIEHLYRPGRAGAVATAADSIVQYANWIERGEAQRWEDSPILTEIRNYNREDCVSACQLAEWLRTQQAQENIPYIPPALKAAEGSDDDSAKEEKNAERDRLIESLNRKAGDANLSAEDRRIHQMLADLIEFHRRDEKPSWWRLFEREMMTHEELKEDIGCIGDATLCDIPAEQVKQSLVFTYQFDPDQDTKIQAGEHVRLVGNINVNCEVFHFDENGIIKLKLGKKSLQKMGGHMPRRTSFLPDEQSRSGPLRMAIEAVASAWDKRGELPAALRRFFLRRPPALAEYGPDSALCLTNEDIMDAAVRVAASMENSTLCLQGPPGTGKTFAAARMISSLLSKGKRIGVTSNSHKAILNLLRAINKEMGGQLRGIKVGDDDDQLFFTQNPGVVLVKSSTDALNSYSGGVAAGTAWLFARPEWADQLDYLFIDEAGQVSTANLVAMSRSASNYVLLGDQMQLEQPIQGSHPGQSGFSALNYFLADYSTIPDSLGLFLPQSRRMHPKICHFISELVYEGRLKPFPGNENRRVVFPESGPLKMDAGIIFLPIEHDGNIQGSDEEADQISGLASALVGRQFMDISGKASRPLTWEDLLFVAPYNMQVRKLKKRLPKGSRVGSVDKFQGQEAAVVFVSMCSSFGEYGSRGIEFILNQNRMNVALSRAQALAIVVGDPRISTSPAHSVDGMRQLNLYCRLTREHGLKR